MATSKATTCLKGFRRATCGKSTAATIMSPAWAANEFVIVAPGLSPEAASEKASRPFLHSAGDLKRAGRSLERDLVGMSVGAAFCPQDGFEVEPCCWPRRIGACTSVKEAHTTSEPNGDPELFEAGARAPQR